MLVCARLMIEPEPLASLNHLTGLAYINTLADMIDETETACAQLARAMTLSGDSGFTEGDTLQYGAV